MRDKEFGVRFAVEAAKGGIVFVISSAVILQLKLNKGHNVKSIFALLEESLEELQTKVNEMKRSLIKNMVKLSLS